MNDKKCSLESMQGFALRLLTTPTLAGKLSGPGFSDSAKLGAFKIPDLPSRPEGLALSNSSNKGRKIHTFPGKSTLDQDRSRGLVLHFFANHELLAIEIMAVAILKFPETPVSFLRGIVQTIIEEQTHMKLYIQRMKDLGVEFGEAPLNGFFWKSLRSMKSPEEFVAGMSLTFEQANLDFSRHFENEFTRLQDTTTAKIMERVRLDEIGHVKHGVVWLSRWKDPTMSLWKTYLENIHFPVTPMRGKGPTFDRESRRLAGLDEEFINEIEIYNTSKGRPPRVFWLNLNCELEIAAGGRGFNPPKSICEMSEDLSTLMMFLAHRDDVVVVAQKPSSPWLTPLHNAGFEIPEFVESFAKPGLAVQGRKIGTPIPWGWSPSADFHLSKLLKQMVSGHEVPPHSIWKESDPKKNIFSKGFSATMRRPSDLPGACLTSLESVETSIQKHFLDSKRPVILKACYGSSGRNTLIISKPEGLGSKEHAWILHQLDTCPILILETWVDRIADVSIQFEVSTDGSVQIHGITRFFVNRRGQYKGHYLGKLLDGLPTEVAKIWHKPDTGWEAEFYSTAHHAAVGLHRQGYHGPAGIDGFIYKDGESLGFQSLSEINPRLTMGRIALELSKHLIPKTPTVWWHLSLQELRTAGYQSFAEFAESASMLCPPVIRTLTSGQVLLENGLFFTNDPSHARQTLTFLAVDCSVPGINMGSVSMKT